MQICRQLVNYSGGFKEQIKNCIDGHGCAFK